ncbi:hypothetical protein ACKFKF_15470 [Phormidesmis sp. 146-12]
MKFKVLSTAALMTIALIAPVRAENQPKTTAQSQPDQRQILEACVQNRAETLPNPFSDVPANHWAFKAVLTMHYCGAFRQATPPSLVDRLVNESQSPRPQPVQ